MRFAVRPVHCLLFVVAGCSTASPGLLEAPPGEAVPGLNADEAARFAAGRALFEREFTPEEGLGPLFNQARCSSCHDLPTTGGHGAEPVTRATHFDPESGCDLLAGTGGDLLQKAVTPAARAAGLLPERNPGGATAASDLRAPALYGLGLIEAVPDAEIVARADPDDLDGDGISGRPGTSADGSHGRFGVKATHPTLASFIEEATAGELGLTTPGRPAELLPQGRPLPEGVDPASDPEVDAAFLGALADYVRFLAPPAAEEPANRQTRATIRRGRVIFSDLGCAACHVPEWTTGSSPVIALDRKRFRAWSDFLLHDLGPDLADICGAGAEPSEWRTTPLVGLRLRSVFLHDGRAQRLGDAIALHGGEATRSRDLFRSLPPRERDDLIRFLQSL